MLETRSTSGGSGFCTYWNTIPDNSRAYSVSKFQTSSVNTCPMQSNEAIYNTRMNEVFMDVTLQKASSIIGLSVSRNGYRRQKSVNSVGGISSSSADVEEGGSAVLTATLDYPALRDITLELATGGTVAPGDVETHEGHTHIVIPKGEIMGHLEFVVVDDDEDDDGEILQFAIAGADGTRISTHHQVNVGIVDNDGLHCLDTVTDKNCNPDEYDEHGRHTDPSAVKIGLFNTSKGNSRRLLFGGVKSVGPGATMRAVFNEVAKCVCHDPFGDHHPEDGDIEK